MKRILLITLSGLYMLTAYSQINLEKTYNYSATVVKLETLGYKYYLMDVPNNQCRIYNMDHSVYKTINCPVPAGYYLWDIKFISENIFDNDPELELACCYYKYVPTTNSYYYMYSSSVIDENGNVLLNIAGAEYLYLNQTAEDEIKLFAYCYDYSVFPEIIWTNIYGLPGTQLPDKSYPGIKIQPEISAYPNPSNDYINLSYKLPSDVKSANLYLMGSNGSLVKVFPVDDHSDFISLDVNQLSSGIYHYFLEYGNIRSITKKIVVE